MEGECPAQAPNEAACVAQLRHGSLGASGGGSRWRRALVGPVLDSPMLTTLWAKVI